MVYAYTYKLLLEISSYAHANHSMVITYNQNYIFVNSYYLQNVATALQLPVCMSVVVIICDTSVLWHNGCTYRIMRCRRECPRLGDQTKLECCRHCCAVRIARYISYVHYLQTARANQAYVQQTCGEYSHQL